MPTLLYLRIAGYAAIVFAIIGGYWAIENHGYKRGKAEVQVKFDSYKGEINDQLSKAIIAKAKIEAAQNAKFLAAQRDLYSARGDLDSILSRLRDGTFVLGDKTVPVAGCGGDTMPCTPAGAGRTQVTLKNYNGTCDVDFFSDALKDNLQCSALIEFLK